MVHKQKTHSATKKRFKITAGKKVIAKKEGNNHLLTNKGKNHKKSPYGKQVIGALAKRIKSLFH